MATLQYIGRSPDSDSTIVPKSYADAQQASLAVTTGVVNTLISGSAVGLTSKAYVDSGDAAHAQQAAVIAADNNYVAASKLGVASGVASLDSSGNLITGQIPTSGVVTDRVATCYSIGTSSGSTGGLGGLVGGLVNTVTGAVGTILLGTGSSHTCNTSSPREFKIATITIPDPGYPYRVLPFAWVQGNSSAGIDPGTRTLGNGDYGLLTCMPPSGVSDQVYGIAVCTASRFTDSYLLTPYAVLNQTNISVPAVTGSLILDLYGSCWSGATYTFYGTNLSYFVWVVPGL